MPYSNGRLAELNQSDKEQLFLASVERMRQLSRGPGGFRYFVYNVFAESFGMDFEYEDEDGSTHIEYIDEFVGGSYIDEVCDVLQSHKWTMDISARDHFKSMRLYARVMWAIFTMEKSGEGHYFSFNSDMAAYHLGKIKAMISQNHYFIEYTDNKPTADSILSYTFHGSTLTFTPQGLLAFKRGIHADYIFIDDPLRDPENKLKPTVIEKINRIMKQEMYSMVKAKGECRVVGTPQTWQDFFFDAQLKRKFHTRVLDSMVDEVNRIALWPEWKTFDDLEEIRNDLGNNSFNQEYRCQPAYAENSYIKREFLLNVVSSRESLELKPHRGIENCEVVGGFDIGKKTHPSHLALFEIIRKHNTPFFRQLFSKWMDHWEYTDQLEYLEQCIDIFNVNIIRYDNTRGEFEGFAERGQLPPQLKPINLTGRNRFGITANFDSLVTSETIELINDQRQTNQILAVNSDLEAMQSPDGHGDSFWSVALAVYDTADRRSTSASVSGETTGMMEQKF